MDINEEPSENRVDEEAEEEEQTMNRRKKRRRIADDEDEEEDEEFNENNENDENKEHIPADEEPTNDIYANDVIENEAPPEKEQEKNDEIELGGQQEEMKEEHNQNKPEDDDDDLDDDDMEDMGEASFVRWQCHEGLSLTQSKKTDETQIFTSLKEAKVEAVRLGSACGGITLVNGVYELRAASAVLEKTYEQDTEMSWTRIGKKRAKRMKIPRKVKASSSLPEYLPIARHVTTTAHQKKLLKQVAKGLSVPEPVGNELDLDEIFEEMVNEDATMVPALVEEEKPTKKEDRSKRPKDSDMDVSRMDAKLLMKPMPNPTATLSSTHLDDYFCNRFSMQGSEMILHISSDLDTFGAALNARVDEAEREGWDQTAKREHCLLVLRMLTRPGVLTSVLKQKLKTIMRVLLKSEFMCCSTFLPHTLRYLTAKPKVTQGDVDFETYKGNKKQTAAEIENNKKRLKSEYLLTQSKCVDRALTLFLFMVSEAERADWTWQAMLCVDLIIRCSVKKPEVFNKKQKQMIARLKNKMDTQFIDKQYQQLSYRHLSPLWCASKEVLEEAFDGARARSNTAIERDADLDLRRQLQLEQGFFPKSSELNIPVNRYIEELPENKIRGTYGRKREYVQTHISLIQADCFATLMADVQRFQITCLRSRDQSELKDCDRLQNAPTYTNGRYWCSVYVNCELLSVNFLGAGAGLCHSLYFELFNPNDVGKPFHADSGAVNWEWSKKLERGALVALSVDGFHTTFWATIVHAEMTMLQDGLTFLRFFGNDAEGLIKAMKDMRSKPGYTMPKGRTRLVMVESGTFFAAYKPVLKCLQRLKMGHELPFSSELCHADCTHKPPKYISRVDPEAVHKVIREVLTDSNLDASQASAVELALNHRVCLIQGPPGTGKTFVGLKVCDILFKLRNMYAEGMTQDKSSLDKQAVSEQISDIQKLKKIIEKSQADLRQEQDKLSISGESASSITQRRLAEVQLELARLRMERRKVLEEYMGFCETIDSLRPESGVGPMLIITYKNRALDQFLIGIRATITENIVRVGSRSRSPLMAEYNIRHIAGKYKGALHSKTKFNIGRRLAYLKELLKEATANALTLETQKIPRLKTKIFLAKENEFSLPSSSSTSSSARWRTGGGPSQFQKESLVESCPDAIAQALEGKSNLEQLYLDLWLGHVTMREKDGKWVFTRHARGKEPKSRIGGGDAGSDLASALGIRQRKEGHAAAPGALEAAAARKQEAENDEDFEVKLNKRAAKKTMLGISEGFEKNQFERLNTDFVAYVTKEDSSGQTEQLAPVGMRGERPIEELREIPNVWMFSHAERIAMAREWALNYEHCRLRLLNKAYEEATNDFTELRHDSTLRALMSADVVGMTTTGCAQYPHLLAALSPSIVIVEESAEILEGQLLPCLTKRTQHLVMIGDHKQLQPSVQVYPLELSKNLHISLFERLTMNGFPVQTLAFQRRMHPNIASCISTIYPMLKDHPWVINRKFDPAKAAKTAADKLNIQVNSEMGGEGKVVEKVQEGDGLVTPVKRGKKGGEMCVSLGLYDEDEIETPNKNSPHPETPQKRATPKGKTSNSPFGSPNATTFDIEGPCQVPGMEKNLYFWQHTHPECVSASGFSVANMHEVEMIVFMARYFLRQRVPASAITVLATYQGQTRLLKDALDEMTNELQADKIEEVHTVDNYQGDENDIVLLSLVRSNDTGKIGFLNKPNRYCVALSRARHGLYVAGNLEFLASKSDYWRGLLQQMQFGGHASDCLPLVCPRHPNDSVVQFSSKQKVNNPHTAPYWIQNSRGRGNHSAMECKSHTRSQVSLQLRAVADFLAVPSNSVAAPQQRDDADDQQWD